MKPALQIIVLLLLGALSQAEATPYTTLLNDASNTVAVAFASTVDAPKTHAALGRALKDFQRSSTGLAGDFNILVTLAAHLAPLQKQPPTEASALVAAAVDSTFSNFVGAAAAQVDADRDQTAALSDYQKLKKTASNQVFQAEAALEAAQAATSTSAGLTRLRLAFAKVAAAEKLLRTAGARPGARDSFTNILLTHKNAQETGTAMFYADGTYTEVDGGGTYTYVRTGLNTAKLDLYETTGGHNTAYLTYNAAGTGGSARGVFVDTNGETGRFTATFTVQEFTP